MNWTGRTMAAVMPQMRAAPQPPRSKTLHPSDPSRKPGFARQITNPSYQRSVLRSRCSSTTACATLHLHRRYGLDARPDLQPGRKYHRLRTVSIRIALHRLTIRAMRGPPIHVTCDCGSERDLRYGEKWTCEQCGKRWNTEQIPAEEYGGLIRDLRRLRYGALIAALCAVAIVLPLAYFVNLAFLFLGPMFLALAAMLLGPFWKRRARRVV